jgi:hypothetical protein
VCSYNFKKEIQAALRLESSTTSNVVKYNTINIIRFFHPRSPKERCGKILEDNTLYQNFKRKA